MSKEEMSETTTTTTTNYNYENVNADAASISIRGDIVRADAEPTELPAMSNGTAAGMLTHTLYICSLWLHSSSLNPLVRVK